MMTDDLNEPTVSEARLRVLLEAYGADPRRWPAEERDQAERRLALSGEAVADLRREADDLDDLLWSVPNPVADTALRQRIIASATRKPAAVRRPRLWWAGVGLAGVGLAGALAGAVMVSVIGPGVLPAPSSLEPNAVGATVFGDLDDGSES